MGVPEIEAFLTYLAVQENGAASTQNQAFSAVLFLYQAVLKLPLDDSINAVRARRSKYLPTVVSKSEVRAVLQETAGVPQLLLKTLRQRLDLSKVFAAHGIDQLTSY
jgi:site-specific recombinase XerD